MVRRAEGEKCARAGRHPAPFLVGCVFGPLSRSRLPARKVAALIKQGRAGIDPEVEPRSTPILAEAVQEKGDGQGPATESQPRPGLGMSPP